MHLLRQERLPVLFHQEIGKMLLSVLDLSSKKGKELGGGLQKALNRTPRPRNQHELANLERVPVWCGESLVARL